MTNDTLDELKEFVRSIQPFGTGAIMLKNTILNKISELEKRGENK